MRVRVSGPTGIVGGGSECPALSPPWIPQLRWDPWARHHTTNCSPGAHCHCPLLRVCVHGVCVCVFVFTSHCCVCALGWVKCRSQIPSMGHHTWPHVLSFPFLSFPFLSFPFLSFPFLSFPFLSFPFLGCC